MLINNQSTKFCQITLRIKRFIHKSGSFSSASRSRPTRYIMEGTVLQPGALVVPMEVPN